MSDAAAENRPLVFISYAEEDGDAAERIGEALAAVGFRPWRYHTDVLPGDKYPEKVADALARAPTVLILVSEHSLPSQQVENELVQAFERRKRIIPILIGLAHEEFQERAPGWRHCLGGTVSFLISRETFDERVPALVAAVRGSPQSAAPGHQATVPRAVQRRTRWSAEVLVRAVVLVVLVSWVGIELKSRWRRDGDLPGDSISPTKPETMPVPKNGEPTGSSIPAGTENDNTPPAKEGAETTVEAEPGRRPPFPPSHTVDCTGSAADLQGLRGRLLDDRPLADLVYQVGDGRVRVGGYVLREEEKERVQFIYTDEKCVRVDVEVAPETVRSRIQEALRRQGVPGLVVRLTERRNDPRTITIECTGDAAMKAKVTEIVGRYVLAVDEYVTIVALP
ncbi:MAG: toll/interleukin-1 receptor domain-containing protein [Phycisphaerales bacterium]|nr:toll/interleukin-1 receptor domain-containing protein [Phycisphaerales bacterium]